MRSVVHEEFGSPPKVLKVADRPLPEPGPGQVRVRLVLSPIHNHDLMTIAGHYGIVPALPAVPGTEAVGVVEALGAGVDALKIGQRVAGGAQTWAERYLVEARRAVPVPDSVPDTVAAQMISMPLSARLLIEIMGVKAGDWIIQNAANGAVGRLLAGFAADQGVNVVSLVRRDAAIAELAAVGIANVVSTETEGWQERVRALTGGAAIVRGLESVGGRAADDLLGVMADGGTIYSFGALSGRPLQVSADNLLFKQARIEGFWLVRQLQSIAPERVGRLIGEIVGRAAAGKLGLEAGEIFALDEIGAAATAAVTPGRPGKVMLRP